MFSRSSKPRSVFMSDLKHVAEPTDFSGASLSVRCGRFLFRSRNFISAPVFLFLLSGFVWEYENDLVIWSVGPAMVLLGEALRLWAMRHIGRSARTRKDKARKLVLTGPYALTRNPLYLGNHIVLLGFCVLSELLWFAPIALGICFTFYSFIIRYEEELLTRKFGHDYLVYLARTSRWLSFPRLGKMLENGWREAFYRERSTIYGILFGFIAFGLKELADKFFEWL